jgi:hypothetical protein
LLKQLLRIHSEEQRQDHDHDGPEPTADRDSADRHTAPILDIRALPFASPTHSFTPPVECIVGENGLQLCVSRIVF